jgi:hypothetical protein
MQKKKSQISIEFSIIIVFMIFFVLTIFIMFTNQIKEKSNTYTQELIENLFTKIKIEYETAIKMEDSYERFFELDSDCIYQKNDIYLKITCKNDFEEFYFVDYKGNINSGINKISKKNNTIRFN